MKEKQRIKSLEEALVAKKNGAKCCQCGQPIWAAGSGVTGSYTCFSCMIFEADESGIPQSSFYNMMDRRSIPQLDMIQRI